MSDWMHISAHMMLPRRWDGTGLNIEFVNYMLGAYPYEEALKRGDAWTRLPVTYNEEFPFNKLPTPDEVYNSVLETTYIERNGSSPHGVFLFAQGPDGRGVQIDRPLLDLPSGSEGPIAVHRHLIPASLGDKDSQPNYYYEMWTFVGSLRDVDDRYLDYVKGWWKVVCTMFDCAEHSVLKVVYENSATGKTEELLQGNTASVEDWPEVAAFITSHNSKYVGGNGKPYCLVKYKYDPRYDANYSGWLSAGNGKEEGRDA